MSLHKLTNVELRDYCKRQIESLEEWIRRLIDKILKNEYGANYFNFKSPNGENIIAKWIRDEVDSRLSQDQENRYPRPIDACLLEAEIKILTNPNLYNKHFRLVFDNKFIPGNSEMLRLMLNNLVVPRNKLYHANPISVREAEQIICYSNDVIECIKEYFNMNNPSNEFNVPLIFKYSDSLGNVIWRESMQKTTNGGRIIQFQNKEQFYQNVGNELSIELEIDSSFDQSAYEIKWIRDSSLESETNKWSYRFEVSDIGEVFKVTVTIKTTNTWHRMGKIDDALYIQFKVLP